jgi:geranylgeranyl pyrophosphate synthase
MKLIDDKYGSVCKMSLIFVWMLGLGDEKELPELEMMGKHMGIIFKIAYDFANIENDLEHCTDYTYNIVINRGIKESVEIFFDSKARFVEGILKLDIWSTTLKEILDLIEKNIDDALEKTNIDEKYNFSEFSSTDVLSEKSKKHDAKKGNLVKVIKLPD